MTNSEPTIQSAHSYPTVLTTESLEGGHEDVVEANVNVVNAMFEELLDTEEISPAALRSYYVDFYLTQALAGGFAQYVFTAPEREEVDPYVREGLEAMGAAAHLDLFNRTVAAFGALSDTDVDSYLDGGSGGAAGGSTEDGEAGRGVSDAVRRVEELDGEFESILATEDIAAFNAFSEWIFHNPHTHEDEMSWLEQQGPWCPALLEYLADAESGCGAAWIASVIDPHSAPPFGGAARSGRSGPFAPSLQRRNSRILWRAMRGVILLWLIAGCDGALAGRFTRGF